jgi:uncharacterized protein YecT (DUF1311 family)
VGVLGAFLLVGLLGVPASGSAETNIREFDFAGYLGRQHQEDCGEGFRVTVKSIAFADLDGDSREEALVVAWSCLAGTGGPDIHGVFGLDSSAQPRELRIDDGRGWFEGRPIYENLVGNRNYTFDHEDGLLVERFRDGSGRDRPLALHFRWAGAAFTLVAVHRAPTFPASFDCAKARSDAEKTVCGHADLAKADRELTAVYQRLEFRLPSHERKRLQGEQIQWLSQRDKCNYKGVDECLREAYENRLAVLKEWP